MTARLTHRPISTEEHDHDPVTPPPSAAAASCSAPAPSVPAPCSPPAPATAQRHDADSAATANVSAGGGDNDKPGQGGHHRLLRARGRPRLDRRHHRPTPRAQAAKYSDVTLEAVEGTNDVTQQISQVETLISKKVDVIVILPYDGKAAHRDRRCKAMAAGIPVVNLDRVFDTPQASRTWIGGDNYGMGVSAGTTSARS